MHVAFTDVLAEPVTGADLELKITRAEGDDVIEGELTSVRTGVRFPIVNGIPRFVPQVGYTDTFGKQWNMFRTTQLDSATGRNVSEKRFTSETGWSADDIAGKLVLEAGCGAGRFGEVAARFGARFVGLDMSSAVDAAKSTLSAFPNAEFVQASLLSPPFKQGTFDFAYSIGVMQHTPDPQGGIKSVVEVVKPSGQFAFTIYARRPWTKLNAKYLIRPITRRLPSDVLLKGIETVVPAVFPVLDRLFRVPKLGRLAQFVVPVAVYVDDRGFTDEQRLQEAILDTFDMLSPRYDSPMTWEEADEVLKRAGAAKWGYRSRVPLVINGVH